MMYRYRVSDMQWSTGPRTRGKVPKVVWVDVGNSLDAESEIRAALEQRFSMILISFVAENVSINPDDIDTTGMIDGLVND